ncbi:UNVERIFIED_CONTAM: hypothetical protein BEN50_19115 [Euhalothece sp. KZN 001]
MIIASLVAAAVSAGAAVVGVCLEVGPVAGAFFYIGREIAQYEMHRRWDIPGLVAPVGLMLAVLVAHLSGFVTLSP